MLESGILFIEQQETDDYYKYWGQRSNEHIRFYKIDNDYYLIILQVEPFTILLNYEKADDTDFITKIPMVRDYNIHVRKYIQNNKKFKVINTYNAFLNYTSKNGIRQNKEANNPFFACFFGLNKGCLFEQKLWIY